MHGSNLNRVINWIWSSVVWMKFEPCIVRIDGWMIDTASCVLQGPCFFLYVNFSLCLCVSLKYLLWILSVFSKYLLCYVYTWKCIFVCVLACASNCTSSLCMCVFVCVCVHPECRSSLFVCARANMTAPLLGWGVFSWTPKKFSSVRKSCFMYLHSIP